MSHDHTDNEHRLFSRDELIAAHAFLMPVTQAEAFVDDLYSEWPEGADRSSYLADATLDLLSLVSDSCAERVRRLNGQSVEEAEQRRAMLRNQFRRD